MEALTTTSSRKKKAMSRQFDDEYGINIKDPEEKKKKRESFSRGTNERLEYYKRHNPEYFRNRKTVAENKSYVELWEAVIWQAANDYRSADAKIEALLKKKKIKGQLTKYDAEHLVSAMVAKADAVKFFQSDNLESICDLIGYDASYIRNNIGKLIIKESNLYAKKRVRRNAKGNP